MVALIVAAIALGIGYLLYKYRWKIVQFFNIDKKHYADVTVNGTPRMVRRDLPNYERAAEILDELVWSLKELVEYMDEVRPRDRRTKNLVKKFKEQNVMEGTPHNNENSTSFTYGKGELTVFCLRHKDNTSDFHDMNTLLFVGIHELAHIASETYGHNKEFRKNFRWLLHHARNSGIYDPRNYSKEPVKYCGLTIKNNPLFKPGEMEQNSGEPEDGECKSCANKS